MALEVLLEHGDFYVVQKPSGMTMHDPDHGIISQFKRQVSARTLYLCHRLDDGTSGCIIIARNPQAAEYFRELFSSHKIRKFYLALLSAKPSKKQGTVCGDMKNRRSGMHILLKSRQNPAVTQFFSSAVSPGVRGAVVRPLTGRTHQIRVAMKSLGSPILGDNQYAGAAADRLYLHAYALQFIYEEQYFSIVCPPNEGAGFVSEAFTNWLALQPAPETLPWPGFTLPSIQSAPTE